MQEKINVIIIGAGGHGKVVADALIKQNEYNLIGFADDNKSIGENVFLNYKVVCKINESDLLNYFSTHSLSKFSISLAIGNNETRKLLFEKLNISKVNIIHPSAQIALDVQLGNGLVVLANSVINASSIIGDGCIINSLGLVDHDCQVGSFVHVGQSVIVGSGNQVPEGNNLIQGSNLESTLYK